MLLSVTAQFQALQAAICPESVPHYLMITLAEAVVKGIDLQLKLTQV
jgi:hypothetical protein